MHFEWEYAWCLTHISAMMRDRVMISVQFGSVWTFIFAHSYSKSYHERATGKLMP